MLRTKIPDYFKTRRQKLMDAHPGAVFFFPSHPYLIRNSDVHFPHRQDSSLYYLSGFDEPESFLVLTPDFSAARRFKTILFVQPRDPEKEMWEGERYGLDGALKTFGVDETYPIQELDKKLPEFLDGCERLYYKMGLQPGMDKRILAALETHRYTQGRSGRGLLAVVDSTEAVGELRLFKGSEEIDLLKKACDISAEAHKNAMRETRPGMNESEIEALIDFGFRRKGCERVGYPSIVAGGKNSTCLHYRSNNETLKEGDLLLIDAGGEFSYYTADITRTFPVSKSFSPAQARIYSLVLKVQKDAIENVCPGTTLTEIHARVCEGLVEGMLSLGLLKGSVRDILKSREYRRFYPHNTSHWLGMDVHDAGLYIKNGEPRVLEAGMVLTIEPGFYVQPSDSQAPAEYRNIGIRIEDDVLVTAGGNEVLTKDAPKEISEIEALRF
ncbi:MAG: aminopeptidase P N-terminal domain-containing protein [Bdellovibrio sp.]|nr:aminopeptidase P N-terminal domain-containing protein [Bdellovibrio sp.]